MEIQTEATTEGFIGTDPIQFGSLVKDIVTDDEGIVVAKFYQNSGCCLVAFRSKTTKDFNNKWLLHHSTSETLKVLKENTIFSEQPSEKSVFKMGEKVEIPLKEVKGSIISICFYPDQCPHVEVQPVFNSKEGRLPNAISEPEALVESLERLTENKDKRKSPPCDLSPRALSSKDLS